MRERLAAAAYATAWATVRWAPERPMRRVFRGLADSAYRRRGRSVRRLEGNLRRALGPDATDDEVAAVVRAAMRSNLRYWFEVFRLPVIPGERIVEQTRCVDEDRLRTAFASGRGVILALPHMGNWDHAGAWCVQTGMPFTTVAERLEPSSLFDRFVEFRRGLGMEVLPLTGGSTGPYPILRARLEEGGMLCLLADRDLTATGIEVRFFGEAARMPAGPASLALDTGAALLPVTLWYPDDGPGVCVRIHPEVVPPATGDRHARVVAMTQAMADAFAESIAAHPSDWHMFQRVFTIDLDPARDAVRTGRAATSGAA